MAQFLQRRLEGERNGTFDVERDDLAFYQRCPAIAEHMCHDRWESGEKRATTTFMIFFEEGSYKCWVHDRAMRRSCFVSARTVQELVDMVEEGLRRDLLVWRPDKATGRK